jgi:predicted nucleic acid-binding protein
MRDLGIMTAFAFDKHFKQEGLLTEPGEAKEPRER